MTRQRGQARGRGADPAGGAPRAEEKAAPRPAPAGSEKELAQFKELAQKLGQLQPLIAMFPQECRGQLLVFGPT
jgi:hypothetical protein